MATRSTSPSGAAAKTVRAAQPANANLEDRKPASLRACIEGLQYVLALSTDNKKDPLLEVLVPALRQDILDALSKIHGGDDTGKTTNPDEN